jgi:hypothetical protein
MQGKIITNNLSINKLTLREIAKLSGVVYQTLIQNRAANKYSTDTLEKIAEGTGLHFIELVCSKEQILEFFALRFKELEAEFPNFIENVFSKIE